MSETEVKEVPTEATGATGSTGATDPVASDATDSKKRPAESQQPEDSDPKRIKAEAEADEEEGEVEDSPAHFVNWRWLTTEILDKCVTWSEPKHIKGKCSVVWLNFNYDLFAKLCPDHPPVLPRMKKLFYSRPFLKTPFGYSPHMTANGVQNNLRLTFGDWADVEATEYYARTKEWDEWLKDQIFKHKDTWPLKIKLEKGEVLTREMVAKKYRPIARDPEKDGVVVEGQPQYMGLKLVTQKEVKAVPKKGIEYQKADPYTAILTVWNSDKELVCEKLTRDNAVPSKDEIEEDKEIENKRNIIINKNDYVQGIDHFQKLYFAADFGPTIIADEVLFQTEENLKAVKNTKKSCRF